MNMPALTFQLGILFTGHIGGGGGSLLYDLLLDKGLGFVIFVRDLSILLFEVARDTSVFVEPVEQSFLK